MASKIKVDELETVDGTGTIALQNQLSGMTTASLPTLTSAQMPTGSVLQVVHAYTESSTSVATTTYTDIGLSATITPSSTSSKILVTWNIIALLTDSSADRGYSISTLRDSTALYDPSGGWVNGYIYNPSTTTTLQNTSHSSNTYLDSPSSTSALVYKCQAKTLSSRSVDINGSGGRIMITLMEIAG
jgi:hypothetical protein